MYIFIYQIVPMSVSRHMTLSAFLQSLCDDNRFQLRKPSAVSSSSTLYMCNPPSLEEVTRPNLNKSLCELMDDGEVILVSSPVLKDISLSLLIQFSD